MNGTTRKALTFLASVSATACLTATGAFAHGGDHWPIAGDSLKMGYSPNGQGTGFAFKSKGQVNINALSTADDLKVERSTLFVRGTGTAPGSSGVIVLDPDRWTRIGTPEAPKGWMFKGDPYYTGGVSKILLKIGKKNGSLQIQAKGYSWPFQINGPQDSVQVVLTLGGNAICAEFSADRLADFQTNINGAVQASYSLAPSECPQVCGNGIVEVGEQCDDGNDINGDTCTNTCEGCNPADAQFASTYEGIQGLIFDNPTYNCTNNACHGSAAQGGLDLRSGASHADLVNVDSQIQPTTPRVYPGDQDLSVLYKKLADKTLSTNTVPGTSMPVAATALTPEHLEALRLWIRGGAPETGVVAGTAELLDSCLPPATPLDIPQPEVPDAALGTQFAMPGYKLSSGTEIEGCVATYYDVSATVPEADMVACPGAFPGTNETGPNAGKCFSFNKQALYQDAQSHHSIVHIYPGQYSWNDSGWGSWRCYGGATDGASCSPETTNTCGTGGVCGSKFHQGVACLDTLTENWGAPDFNTGSSPQFSGSQESTATQAYPAGVYGVLPLKGLIVWNSHAFNLTTEDATMNGWINMSYTDTRTWPARGLFADQWIFTQNVPPFQQREYCATFTFPQNSHIFQLSSHTHRHGIRWRYYEAPQTPCSAPGGFTSASCLPGDPADMFYESYDYSDALTQHYDPPKTYSGTVEDRTIKFCSLYDNGLLNPDTVKTKSGSPTPTGNLIIGGPCSDSQVQCMGGLNKGQLCNNNDSNCPDSTCDACPLRGGVTTQDEMFIAIGTYYVAP